MPGLNLRQIPAHNNFLHSGPEIFNSGKARTGTQGLKPPKMHASSGMMLMLIGGCLDGVSAFNLLSVGNNFYRNTVVGLEWNGLSCKYGSLVKHASTISRGLQLKTPGSRQFLRICAPNMLYDTSSKTSSWNELESILSSKEQPKPPAKLTLYRDTNGWCPFCERVWIALEYKKIEHDTVKISLMNKPQWFKDIVPTALVPAIELHDSAWKPDVRGSGRLMWESADILKSLDDLFPDSPPLR